MAEPLCPLIRSGCLKDECLWYAAGIQKCAIVAIGMMLNTIHDMGVQSFQRFVGGTETGEEDGG